MSCSDSQARLDTWSLTSMVSERSHAGIPVKSYPEDPVKMPAVQYAALIADLVVKTKQTLGSLDRDQDKAGGFHYIRMRTKQDTELIVTDYTAPGGNEYILVVIQQCIFKLDDEIGEGEEGKAE